MKHLITFLFCLFTTLKHTNTSAFEIVKTPAAENSLAPNLCAFGDQFTMSWIERNKDGTARLQMARWNGLTFDKKNLIAQSKEMFANWADVPSLVEAPSGDLYVH